VPYRNPNFLRDRSPHLATKQETAKWHTACADRHEYNQSIAKIPQFHSDSDEKLTIAMGKVRADAPYLGVNGSEER
jgi:hypothetical protein